MLLGTLIVVVVAFTACARGEVFSLGERVSDDAHAFLVTSAEVVDRVGEATPPEEHSYLIIGFEVENLRGQQDISRDWSHQIRVERVRGEESEPTSLTDLEDQLWNTTLSPGQKEVGSMAFTAPEQARDFKLTFQFPASETIAIYEFLADDQRLGVRVSHILGRLEQIERARAIPVIGGALESFTRVPILYFGEVLVPEEDIPILLEQLQGLSEEARQRVIEAYAREQKGQD